MLRFVIKAGDWIAKSANRSFDRRTAFVDREQPELLFSQSPTFLLRKCRSLPMPSPAAEGNHKNAEGQGKSILDTDLHG
jgi:hypothetical protein